MILSDLETISLKKRMRKRSICYIEYALLLYQLLFCCHRHKNILHHRAAFVSSLSHFFFFWIDSQVSARKSNQLRLGEIFWVPHLKCLITIELDCLTLAHAKHYNNKRGRRKKKKSRGWSAPNTVYTLASNRGECTELELVWRLAHGSSRYAFVCYFYQSERGEGGT